MYLRSLTIHGFKSFAKKSELEFTTAITAIVGPNGSGKSNVAEAFRFVLGEQSIKSLRGKKGEDLIFNGSENVARGNRASVSILLHNQEIEGKRVFPLDFDEIHIERAVYRDGTNEYSINGGKVRLKDVQELLASANIGPSGHHIISQGEADRILSASHKERREMIEDALGLKVYQFKKIESERKLKKTRENIKEVELLRREAEPHLRFLERQVKKMERSRELQNELAQHTAEYLKREDIYLKNAQERLTREKGGPENKKKEIENMLREAKGRLESARNTEKLAELSELKTAQNDIKKERQVLARELGQLEGQVLFLEKRVRRIMNESGEKKEIRTPIPYERLLRIKEDIERSADRAIQASDNKSLIRVLRDVVHALSVLLREAKEVSPKVSTESEEKELKEILEKKQSLEIKERTLSQQEEDLSLHVSKFEEDQEKEREMNHEAERAVFSLMNDLRDIERTIDTANREEGMVLREREDFKEELQEAVTLLGRRAAFYIDYVIEDGSGSPVSEEEIIQEERTVQYERRRALEKMKIRLEELGTGHMDEVVNEHKNALDRDQFLEKEITDLTVSASKLESLIEELDRELKTQFVAGIDQIAKEFSRFFTLMFEGGSASLVETRTVKNTKEDVDEGTIDECAEEGLEIKVQIPNKRVRSLEMLSGGERALTSIALIFAMSQVNPPLFIILDETDAALDEANSRRYGDMVTALSKRSELILITHNRETMSRAGVLYGVTMAGDGASKLLSIKFDDALQVAK